MIEINTEAMEVLVKKRVPMASFRFMDGSDITRDTQETILSVGISFRVDRRVTDEALARGPEELAEFTVSSMVRELERGFMGTFEIAIEERMAHLRAELERQEKRAVKAESERDNAYRAIRMFTKEA